VTVTDGTVDRTVLDTVSLHVDAGEMVAVMGPSGSGKTTLIDVACGLARWQHGVVAVLGTPVASGSPVWPRLRREIVGVVHQRLNLLDGLSTLDNVAVASELRSARRSTALARARAGLERVGIGHLAGTPAGRLSVGEQQRVAIARAIAEDRPLLLADEPSAALDRTSADEVTSLLAGLAHEGRAVLMVTHDAQQASWADRTIVLRDGVVVDRIGEPSGGRAPEDSAARP
jgi:putative ABC transport system ATP-binding protein